MAKVGYTYETLKPRLDEYREEIYTYLHDMFSFGYKWGNKLVPLRWHQGIKSTLTKTTWKNHPDIREGRKLILQKGKELAAKVLGVPESKITGNAYLIFLSLITVITYEFEKTNIIESVLPDGTKDIFKEVKVQRNVTTFNPEIVQKFCDYLRTYKGDEKTPERIEKSFVKDFDNFLELAQTKNPIFPNYVFKSSTITRSTSKTWAYFKDEYGNKNEYNITPYLILKGWILGYKAAVKKLAKDKKLSDHVLNVYYLKGNNTPRVLSATYDVDLVKEIYEGNDMLSEEYLEYFNLDKDVDTMRDKAIESITGSTFNDLPKYYLHDEFGSDLPKFNAKLLSIMDMFSNEGKGLLAIPDVQVPPKELSPMRTVAVNRIARIRGVVPNKEELRKFGEVVLKDVPTLFMEKYYPKLDEDKKIKLAMKLYTYFEKELVGLPDNYFEKEMNIIKFFLNQESLRTITFLKELHIFMVNNKEAFFNGYLEDGEKQGSVTEDEKAELLDLDLDIEELDLLD